MELWIRSQNKKQLLKVNDGLYIANGFSDTDDTFIGIKNIGHIGRYNSELRALEVLDDIQNKIKTLLYLKPKSLLGINEIKAGKKYFEKLNGIDFITCDNNFEIEPITTNVIVYEMPEE